MNREFSINVVILVVINFLIKPAYIFAVEAGIQNLVGPATYGQYFILLDFVFLFVFMNDLGIQNYNSKHVAQNRAHLGDYFGQMLGLKLISIALFFLTVVIAGALFGYLQESGLLLLLITGVFAVNASFILVRSSLSALGYYRWDSWISALDKLLLLIGLGILVYRGYHGAGFQILWLPIGQLIAGLISLVIALLLVVQTRVKIRLSFGAEHLVKIAKSTWPYMLILLLSSAYNRIDAVMLDQLLVDGHEQSGYYAAAYRFIEVGNMIGFLFASLLLPMFAHRWTERRDFTKLFQLAFKVLFLIGMLASAFSYFYADTFYGLLYTAAYADQSVIMKVLMISFLPVTLSHVFGSMLLASDHVKVVNVIFLCGLVLNIGCNAYLIPAYKAVGACWATVFTQYFLLLGMMIYVLKRRLVSRQWRMLLSSLGIAMMVIGVLIMMTSYHINIWISIGIVGAILLIHIYFSRWLRWSDIMALK